MQKHLLLQPSHSNLIDYCQQCQCYHETIFYNGQLISKPCQNIISQTAIDQKVYTQTNVTSPNSYAQSLNSISTVSIKNHLNPSTKQHVVRPDKYKNLYVIQQLYQKPQQIPSKSPQRPLNIKKQNISQQKVKILQYHPHNIQKINKPSQMPYKVQNQNRINTLVQNSFPIQNKSPRYISRKQQRLCNLPIIYGNNVCQSCFETPQFGSQSIISQNKQNSLICSRKQIKQRNKQFTIPQIIDENRYQKIQSQISQDGDYFCCGYIKKFNNK